MHPDYSFTYFRNPTNSIILYAVVLVVLKFDSVIQISLPHSAPTLLVAVQPAEVTALDRRPYNIFTLRCIANTSEGVVLPKSFVWRNGDDVISDNGNTVLIANYDTMMPNSISELTVYRPEIGNYVYTCEVSISVPGGENISIISTGRAIVKGIVIRFWYTA